MTDDAELVRRYVADRSEAAFTELVRRRIDLVYSVALRQVGGDAHLAEDVTQKVFADLARKAPALLGRAVLSGWLYRSTQYAASDLVRSERRRRAREQQTSVMNELLSSDAPPTDWDRLRPLLDEAMAELKDPDRDAIALRFFEGRAFAEVGRALQLTEEAARKRVDRALDKLAGILSRRGVSSTTAAVGAALAHQAAVAAPAGLAASVAGSALAGASAAAAAGGFFSSFGSGLVTLGVGGVAAFAIGAAVHQSSVVREREAEVSLLTQQNQAAQAKMRELEQRVQAADRRAQNAEQRAADVESDNAKLLAAIDRQSAARTAASPVVAASAAEAEPLTHDAVEARYRRAQQLARTGEPAEALRELLWCFDVGMPPITGFGGVRMSFLLSDIAKLGEKYPPALAALRERRDKAEKRLLISASDYEATSTFSSINNYLKEHARTLAVFDQLPADDRRRAALASTAFEELRERQRYADALTGRSFVQMTQQLERTLEPRPLPPGIANPERIRKTQRDFAIATAAKHVEVLAGARQIEQARALADKVLAADGSAETRALLQKHAERAGQPGLLR